MSMKNLIIALLLHFKLQVHAWLLFIVAAFQISKLDYYFSALLKL
jgi:hypothetical protein